MRQGNIIVIGLIFLGAAFLSDEYGWSLWVTMPLAAIWVAHLLFNVWKGTGGRRWTRDIKLHPQYKDGFNTATLEGVNLSNNDLSGLGFIAAKLRMANLSGANLRGATFTTADLGLANLRGADLRGASLLGADLWKAKLKNAKYNAATSWPKDFDPVKAGAVLVEDDD